VVPVANTRKKLYSEFERDERRFGDVLDIWGRAGVREDEEMQPVEGSSTDHNEGDGLYVKDWHLLDTIERQGRTVDEIYEVPLCFRGKSTSPLSAIANPKTQAR
jgi:hypothetical protein